MWMTQQDYKLQICYEKF